ncbi:hypothetical protein GCM10010112_06960 [Actinoplanes lobatus]|uniref:Uncharacterized protein YegL n=1 Tax=Actinoplanes lobatus TaxID=113568 RepID=A0A7W7HAV7_9ACTN|nr:hypothetical protein [Actinoplanes lobatus]MBB4747116.1 uncharacterized protein YegL [Actinoplanes lobatus]GGN55794.1 hypothetical protein GCM10010112_06960 [Actinoplanes lobatus]GIE39316.1 hypothetical protein Alo02nite_22140 [Actinoplanes lobatus]
MTPIPQETLQPLYLLCDASVRMREEDLAAVNLLLGHLADEITGDPLLASAVRWGIELYDNADHTTTLMQLQQVDLISRIPQMVTTIEEPTLAAALRALRRRITGDIDLLEADAAEVRPPIVIVATSGVSLDSAADRAAELDALLQLTPMVLLLSLPGADGTLAKDLAAEHADVDAQVISSLADVPDVAHWIGRGARQSAEYGLARLRYARWVVAERAVDAFHRFAEPGGRPTAELIDLVAIRADPGGDELAERLLWPYRVVVGDDPATAVGLLLPLVPDRFTAGRMSARGPEPLSGPDTPAASDGVLRTRICAALADAVDTAHTHGAVLGETALESAAYTAGTDPEVLITDCAGARLGDGPATDLTWLGRFVDHCVFAFLDTEGQALLRRARSNVADRLPSAAEWSDYLNRRAVILQGPPVIEQVQVSPAIVPDGSPVTVRWRGRWIDRLEITGPDGAVVVATGRDHGQVQMVMTRPGAVRLRAGNTVGSHRADTAHVHVFRLPRLTEIRLPGTPLDARDPRTDRWPDMLAHYSRRMLPEMPPVTVPAEPPAALSLTRFPIDVARFFGERPERPRRRWPRFLRRPWA